MSSISWYSHAPISDMQMAALEELIWLSRDAEKFAKQLAIWLLRKSDNLSKPCCVYIPETHPELASVAGKGLHDMLSDNGTTHLHRIMRATNTVAYFSCNCGDVLHGRNDGFTFWISMSENASPSLPEIPLELITIQAIEIVV